MPFEKCDIDKEIKDRIESSEEFKKAYEEADRRYIAKLIKKRIKEYDEQWNKFITDDAKLSNSLDKND